MYIIGLYAFISIIAIISLFKDLKKYQKIFLIVLFAFYCLRFPLGTDIDAYNLYFSQTPFNVLEALGGTPYPDNIGYNVFMCIAKNIYNSFNFYMLFFNVIMLGMIGYIIFKYSKNFYISALILVGGGMFEIYLGGSIRQMVITAIYLIAYYEFLQKNKFIQYYILIFIAITFHWIALILLLVPLFKMYYDHISNKIVKYVVPTILAVGAFVIVTFIVPHFAYLIPGRFSAYFLANSFSLLGLLSRIAILAVVLVAYIFADKTKLDKFDKFSVYMCYVSFLVYLIFSMSSNFSRVSDMFSIIEIVILPKLLVNITKNSMMKLASIGLCVIVNLILLVGDINYVASGSLINKNMFNYPLIGIWEDVDFDELFQGF